MNILLAEDDDTTRALFATAIRRLGHTVTAVGDGLAAWQTFDRERPSTVIADWEMPGLDGIELCRRIREATGDRTFVLMVTSRVTTADLLAALDVGADDYLAKPVSIDQLRARVAIAERRLEINTARRKAETEVARMRWLAGIGQAVITFQHEINNPLAALYGHLESLSMESSLAPAELSEVAGALAQAKRIADVVKQLSRMDSITTVEHVPGLPMIDLAATHST